VPEHPAAYSGTGMVATQALYAFLNQRLHQMVVPTGYGISSLQAAVDESVRSQARSVVMLRIERVDYVQGQSGVGLRMRFDVAVVRDARLVMRKYIDSPLVDVARRGRENDPVFGAVTQALESVAGDLNVALGAT
jgi:hypothetical protein